MVLSQKLHEAFKGTVERITGPRTVSAFKEKGVLSVTEFVIAGDNLVSKCPTWSCCNRGFAMLYSSGGNMLALVSPGDVFWH
ncbi:Autophagy-related protein 3 [Vitis vinifera]|uniref:Autophagy-related protein 3 n=1 Tax=Vitis vinifera TaxID=29760 RepID=A0A438CAW7_VITVI|nr:Autophagy-related protein 3 [Vitis vinifera]